MSEKAKRHDWSTGVVMHCRNLGCGWQRRYRPDAGGYYVGPLEYRRDSAITRWETESRVPPCEGTR
jgi:hypothetical protein